MLDGSSSYTFNLLPANNSLTVGVGGVVNTSGAAHGNITEYRNDGTALMLPITAVSGGLPPGGTADIDFSDVSSGDWFKGAVASAASVGIVEGVGERRFDPQGKLTVAQLITMLIRTQYGRMSGGSEWYSAYIEQAERDGILYASDNLEPAAQVTRAQMALIVTRYVERFNPRWAKSRAMNAPIDLMDVTDEYRSAVEKAYTWNIIRGDDHNRFNPNSTLTRAESAQVLYNYFSIVD